jgi:hypothetical protein
MASWNFDQFLRGLTAAGIGHIEGKMAGAQEIERRQQVELETQARRQQMEAQRQQMEMQRQQAEATKQSQNMRVFQAGAEMEDAETQRELDYERSIAAMLPQMDPASRAKTQQWLAGRAHARSTRKRRFGAGALGQFLPADHPARGLFTDPNAGAAAPDLDAAAAAPTAPAPELGATAGQVRRHWATQAAEQSTPPPDVSTAFGGAPSEFYQTPQPPVAQPFPQPPPGWTPSPATSPSPTPGAAPAVGATGAAPSFPAPPMIDLPGVGQVTLDDLDEGQLRGVVAQISDRVNLIENYRPKNEAERATIAQALAGVPKVFRSSADLARGVSFLNSTSAWVPGGGAGAQTAAALERERKARAEVAAQERARKAAAAAAKAKADARKAATDRYYRLLQASPSWANLNPESQRPLLASLRQAAIDAGQDPKGIPDHLTPRPKAVGKSPREQASLDRREYFGLLRSVTSPHFMKLPAEAREPLIMELQQTARRLGRELPPSAIKAWKTGIAADTRKQVAGKLSSVDQRLLNESLKILNATKKVEGIGDTGKPAHTPQRRAAAAATARRLIQKGGGDASTVDALFDTPPEEAPTPKKGGSGGAAAAGPQTLSPQALDVARQLIASKEFHQEAQLLKRTNPAHHALLMRAYQQLKGKPYAGVGR